MGAVYTVLILFCAKKSGTRKVYRKMFIYFRYAVQIASKIRCAICFIPVSPGCIATP